MANRKKIELVMEPPTEPVTLMSTDGKQFVIDECIAHLVRKKPVTWDEKTGQFYVEVLPPGHFHIGHNGANTQTERYLLAQYIWETMHERSLQRSEKLVVNYPDQLELANILVEQRLVELPAPRGRRKSA